MKHSPDGAPVKPRNMTIAEAVKKCILEDDALLAGHIVFQLHHTRDWNRHRIYALVREVSGASLAQWDDLLYRADRGEA